MQDLDGPIAPVEDEFLDNVEAVSGYTKRQHDLKMGHDVDSSRRAAKVWRAILDRGWPTGQIGEAGRPVASAGLEIFENSAEMVV
jgi:hypothetical protein